MITLWNKLKGTGGSGGGGSASSGANLFDVKTMAEAIAEKGWAFTCKSTRQDLAKTSVPTLYADIKNKYDNADKSMSTMTQSRVLSGYGDSKGIFYNSKLNKYIIVSEYVYYCDSLKSSAELTKVGTMSAGQYDHNYNSFCGENILLVPNLATSTIYKVDLSDWSYKDTTIPATSSSYYRAYALKDGYIYIQSDTKVYKIKDDYSVDTVEELDTNGSVVTIAWSEHNNKWIVGKTDAIYTTTDFSSYTKIKDSVLTKVLLCYDDKIFYFTTSADDSADVSNIYYSDDLFETTETISTVNSRLHYWYTIGSKAYFFTWYDAYPNNYILDMDTLSYVTNANVSLEGIKYANYLPQTSSYVYVKENGSNLYYAEMQKTVGTDTYVIDGNTVEIDYYTKDGFKICLADNTNDTNLATVYSYLGYYNYYRLDTTNETVSLPRNSNLYSMMYVGDNYQDTLDGISGNATRLLPQAENINVTGATPTITISANKAYSFDTAITSLTISDVETSALESVLYFTTGAGTISLSAPNTLRWGGGNEQPTLEPNTVYCIAIRNGLAEIDNFGSAS